MRALTLTQPWASLVAIGAKSIETRSWRTSYTGELAIHAAKGWTEDDQILCFANPLFRSTLTAAGLIRRHGQIEDLALPLGAIVAVVTLTGCMPTERLHSHSNPSLTLQEFAFGNYSDGRWGWLLSDVHRLAEPIPCRGALGLWDVPDDVAARITTQLETVTGRFVSSYKLSKIDT